MLNIWREREFQCRLKIRKRPINLILGAFQQRHKSTQESFRFCFALIIEGMTLMLICVSYWKASFIINPSINTYYDQYL